VKREEWLTGKDLIMNRWKIKPFELVNLLGDELRPYNPATIRPYEIDIMQAVYYAVAKNATFKFDPNQNHLVPHWGILLPYVEDCIFKQGDVEAFEKKRPELLQFKDVQPKTEYRFYREGPSWTIIYEGKPLRGLKGKGFEIILYLVRNERKVFHTDELSVEVDKTLPSERIKQYDSNLDTDASSKIVKGGIDAKDKIYGESMKDLKQNYLNLQQEIREAEENNDFGKKEKLKKELEEFNKHSISLLKRGGQSRQDRDEVIKTKDRTSKRIERALNALKKNDENTWRHFSNALKPINSYFQSYIPDRNISWLTE